MENIRMILIKRYVKYMLVTVFLFASCTRTKKQEISKPNFHLLRKEGKYELANKLIDSLLKSDTNNGNYFFIKGVIQSDLDSFSKAVVNFKKAYQLNYKKSECIQEINFNKRLIEIKDSLHRAK